MPFQKKFPRNFPFTAIHLIAIDTIPKGNSLRLQALQINEKNGIWNRQRMHLGGPNDIEMIDPVDTAFQWNGIPFLKGEKPVMLHRNTHGGILKAEILDWIKILL